MEEVEIKFERENLSGIVAVGTYLLDAAQRMGIYLESDAEEDETENFPIVKIVKGSDLLSAPTKTELEKLSDERRAAGERLAAQAKIERAGEIIIMTTEKKTKETVSEEARREEYRKEFEELPLEKKIASLVELEAIALGDTFSFILNSPYKIVGKLVDVLAEFGWKMDDEAKKQSRPPEHQKTDPEPSVREEPNENPTVAPPPSVSEKPNDNPTVAPPPSVKEELNENPTVAPAPSVSEENEPTENNNEPPPPSV